MPGIAPCRASSGSAMSAAATAGAVRPDSANMDCSIAFARGSCAAGTSMTSELSNAAP